MIWQTGSNLALAAWEEQPVFDEIEAPEIANIR